jgi:hypothetical protein
VGAEATVLVVVVMFISRMGDSQRQQGKWQGEQQTMHGRNSESKMKNLLCNLITLWRRV